jgi:hypothetical protein
VNDLREGRMKHADAGVLVDEDIVVAAVVVEAADLVLRSARLRDDERATTLYSKLLRRVAETYV